MGLPGLLFQQHVDDDPTRTPFGQWYGPLPRTGAEAFAIADNELTRLMRIWLANRGIWDALAGAGPTVPVPATRDDVSHYLDAYGALLAELTG